MSVVVDWATFLHSQPGRLDGEFTGPDSLPLDVGRTRRTIPPALRRALVARDQGCTWPTCNRPAGWCEAHHTPPWWEGGETTLGGLVLFCPHHHHIAHQAGWRVQFDGRDLHVFRPDGTEVIEGFP